MPIRMRIFSLEPLTPLMFRRAKPFETGGRAESLYMPAPSTIVGMIRSAIWESQGKNFSKQDLAREPDFTGMRQVSPNTYRSTYNFKWRLIGPYLWKTAGGDSGIYYPLPLDVFIHEQFRVFR